MPPVRIVIFAKLPKAGFAKTRLIPALGPCGAARLAERMLRHTVAGALAAGLGPVEVCVTPAPDEPAWRELHLPAGLTWSSQGEGDLGERLSRCARRVLTDGPVLLIGTDCPQLDAPRLRQAAEALTDAGAVMIPATDGGYVLLGVSRFHEALFTGIAWSTATVAAETRSRFRMLEWALHELPAQHDMDEPADLPWLPPGWLDDCGVPGRPV